MKANGTGRAIALSLAIVLASILAIVGGTGTAAAQCDPANGTVSGCEGDVGTVESIGANLVSIFENALTYAGTVALLAGVAFFAVGSSSNLKQRGTRWVFGGLIALVVSFALEPLIGVLNWLATNGV